MKQMLPTILLLLGGALCVNKNAAAQEHAATTVKTDTTDEIVIGCSFPPLEAGFLGGDSAWQRFVTRHLVYPKNAVKNKIQGIVKVQFVVGKDGAVSNVEAVSGPAELRQSAIAVIMKSRRWYPAIQRGRCVIECKEMDIVFKLPTE